jgi:nitroreductase
LPKELSTELIESVFSSALRSPSYTNSQPWDVVAVTGEKKQLLSERLFALAKDNAPARSDFPNPKSWPQKIEARTKTHGAKRFQALKINRDDVNARTEQRLMNFKFFGAPCAVFFLMDETLSTWSLTDIGMFVQSVVLSAHAHGLGTCLQASLANYPDAVREVLGIPPSRKLLLGMSMGYPNWDAPINGYKSERDSLHEFLTIY